VKKYLKRMIRRKKNVREKRKDDSPMSYSNDDNVLVCMGGNVIDNIVEFYVTFATCEDGCSFGDGKCVLRLT
jgi:hypothetical protein